MWPLGIMFSLSFSKFVTEYTCACAHWFWRYWQMNWNIVGRLHNAGLCIWTRERMGWASPLSGGTAALMEIFQSMSKTSSPVEQLLTRGVWSAETRSSPSTARVWKAARTMRLCRFLRTREAQSPWLF